MKEYADSIKTEIDNIVKEVKECDECDNKEKYLIDLAQISFSVLKDDNLTWPERIGLSMRADMGRHKIDPSFPFERSYGFPSVLFKALKPEMFKLSIQEIAVMHDYFNDIGEYNGYSKK